MRKNIGVLFLLLFVTLLFTVSACGDATIKVEDLHFDEQFDFTLPEGGIVQYRSFVNVGFDYREYIVISYKDIHAVEKLNWTVLNDKDMYRFKGAVIEHNNRLTAENNEQIAENYLPDYGAVQKIFLENQANVGNATAFLLFDASKASVYICIIKT